MSDSKKNKEKILILFTYFYPYTDFDNYINEEIEILSGSFYKIYFIPINLDGNIMRTLPSNGVLINYPFEMDKVSFKDKINCFLSLDLYQEFLNVFVKRKKKFSVLSAKIIVVSFLKINHYKKKLIEIINKENKIQENEIYIYSYWMLENAIASGFVKKQFNNVKAISRAHSLDIYFERHDIKYIPFSDRIYGILDGIYFISEMGKNYFIKAHNLHHSDKLHVSRLGTNEARSIPHSKAQDVIKIVSVSWILPFKRIELIADALQKITNVKVHWVHIGAYFEERFEALKRYTEERLSLNKNISYEFKGDMKNDEICSYYSEVFFDLFISTSATEGIPVSMMEAMSFGMPVISTNVGGVHEIVEDSYNGFLLDANPDPQAIAQKITSYSNMNNEEKEIIRKNALLTWDTKYNAKKNYYNFVEEFCHIN